jgi:DNA polymerase III delta subunit
MTLQDVKTQIESNSIQDTFIIFKADNNFIPRQYYKAISNCLHLPISYIETLDSVLDNSLDIFFNDDSENKLLRVYSCDTFDFVNPELSTKENLIIITKKVDKETQKLFAPYIVEVGALEEWCIKDYLYSTCKGIDTKYLDWLMTNCSYDINRLQLEIDKLVIFEENERNIVFNEMLQDDAFSDISSKTIFDFTDGIVKKDIKKLLTIYDEIDNIDIEAIGVVTILYQNFRKLLAVWGSRVPTPENTGLSNKQIYAINKLPRVWSESQLVSILDLLSSIDFKIKSGTMPMNILRDYLVVNILSR